MVRRKDGPPAGVESDSMSRAPQQIQFFGSQPLQVLHECAVTEAAKGAESPCHQLAHPDRRPQLGFGNAHGPLLFLSPSPLDPSSATNAAFETWLDQESSLEHRLRSEVVQPYFRFNQKIFAALRDRLHQAPGKRDTLDLAFHTWAIRCPTSNPDRVTEAALTQCVARHLEPIVKKVAPQAIVAMGGMPAAYFWQRAINGWKAWRPIEQLHGKTLAYYFEGRSIPVVLSVGPYQRDGDTRPEVVARALSECLRPEDLQPRVLQAA
jgi:hypothetical protein